MSEALSELVVPATASAEPARAYRFVEAWGMAAGAFSRVLQPRTADEIRAAFAVARRDGVPLGLRGTGNSYGDASVNGRGHVLDVSRMNRILSFDERTGIADVEPGVTVRDLWQHALPRGWWPAVVSGTAFPTLAGVAAMNIHGKNNFAVGTIGDNILDFDIVLPNGELRTCSREENPDLFHAAIGGFGMLGAFSRIRLRTKRIHSGNVRVFAFANHDLGEMMEYMEEWRSRADYLVGWVDCLARGDALGRGLVHRAQYVPEGEDPHPERTLTVAYQELGPNLFGVFPKSELWWVMRLFNHDPGVRLINTTKYWLGRLEALGEPRSWTHAEFSFLLDYVPNWKWSYGKRPGHGLIQFQPFVPHERAHAVFSELLRRNQEAGIVPYLGVFKRHRPDPFWLTHSVDGWSFAMDFKVTPARRAALWDHCARLIEVVLDAGGKFYFAKDLVLGPGAVERMIPRERLDAFLELKRRLDPEELLQTDLWRRVFARLRRASGTRA